jgi:hypothetical protein
MLELIHQEQTKSRSVKRLKSTIPNSQIYVPKRRILRSYGW